MHLLSFLSYLIHSLMAWQTEPFSISLHSYTSILLEYVKYYLNLLKSCWMLHFEVEIFFSFIGFNCQSWKTNEDQYYGEVIPNFCFNWNFLNDLSQARAYTNH